LIAIGAVTINISFTFRIFPLQIGGRFTCFLGFMNYNEYITVMFGKYVSNEKYRSNEKYLWINLSV